MLLSVIFIIKPFLFYFKSDFNQKCIFCFYILLPCVYIYSTPYPDCPLPEDVLQWYPVKASPDTLSFDDSSEFHITATTLSCELLSVTEPDVHVTSLLQIFLSISFWIQPGQIFFKIMVKVLRFCVGKMNENTWFYWLSSM